MGYFLTVTVTATMKCPTGRYRHHLTDSWQRPHEAGTVPVSTPQIRDEAERAQQVGAGTGTHHVLDAQAWKLNTTLYCFTKDSSTL